MEKNISAASGNLSISISGWRQEGTTQTCDNISVTGSSDLSLDGLVKALTSNTELTKLVVNSVMDKGPKALVQWASAIAEAKSILKASREEAFKEEEARRIQRAKTDLEISRLTRKSED